MYDDLIALYFTNCGIFFAKASQKIMKINSFRIKNSRTTNVQTRAQQTYLLIFDRKEDADDSYKRVR